MRDNSKLNLALKLCRFCSSLMCWNYFVIALTSCLTHFYIVTLRLYYHYCSVTTPKQVWGSSCLSKRTRNKLGKRFFQKIKSPQPAWFEPSRDLPRNMRALFYLIQPMRALCFNLWIGTTISWCIVDEYGFGEFWDSRGNNQLDYRFTNGCPDDHLSIRLSQTTHQLSRCIVWKRNHNRMHV